jgi:energy-coupling factor transport system ATP-binding protein
MQITFDHVTFAYHSRPSDQQVALKDLCLEFDTKRMIGVCGTTGSGKSTFISHLNGILKPNSGRVLIDKEDIHRSRKALGQVRQRIGMTFQFPERQFFGRTVWEELSYTLERHQLAEHEIEQRIFSVSEFLKLNIQQLRQRSPFSLSRGEQRKLSIAVILTLHPELLVLDEPTAGMDRANAYNLLTLLQRLHRQHQHQVILVSHNIEFLIKYVDHLIILNHGAVVFTGSPVNLINASEPLATFGISLPPLHTLLHLLHQQYPHMNPKVLTVDEALGEIRHQIRIVGKNFNTRS